MLDWEDLRHFAALHRVGTLSGAARQLGVDHATVSRRLVALERSLSTKLVDRRGGRLLLTSAGQSLGSALSGMQSGADAIERIVAGHRGEIAGEVTISAPPGLAAAVLAPALIDVRTAHPRLALLVIGETRQSDLEKREADLAIRLGRPTRGDLTATKLGELYFRLYASADYLARTSPTAWTFIAYAAPMDRAPHQQALLDFAGDREVSVRTTTVEMQLSLAAAGGGVAMLPDLVALPAGLVPAGGEAMQREVWMILHSDMTHSAPVRAVADAVRDRIREALREVARPAAAA